MDVSEVATTLSDAAVAGRTVEPPSSTDPSFSLSDGYDVGAVLTAQRVGSGSTVTGVKLGFTNTAAWESLGITDPFWAPVFDSTVVETDEVSLAGLVQPRIEPEVVLGFARPVAPGASLSDVVAAVGWVSLGFEIVQCHFPGWQQTAADAIADAGLHALLVLGPRHEPADGEVEALAGVEASLSLGADEVATGTGANALSGPAAAVEWLLKLPGYRGLNAGDIVTTGTLTTAQDLAAGQTWTYRTSGPASLGELSVRTTS